MFSGLRQERNLIQLSPGWRSCWLLRREGYLLLPEGFLGEKTLEKSLSHVSACADERLWTGKAFRAEERMGNGTEVRSRPAWPAVWGCWNVVADSGRQERAGGSGVPAALRSHSFLLLLSGSGFPNAQLPLPLSPAWPRLPQPPGLGIQGPPNCTHT